MQGHDAARPADRGLTEVFYLVSTGTATQPSRMFRLDPLLAACRRFSFDLQMGQIPGDAVFARHWVGPLDIVSTR